MTRQSQRSGAEAPDVSRAIQEFFGLLDLGLTRENLKGFLARCEDQGCGYGEAVKRRLKLYARSMELVHELD